MLNWRVAQKRIIHPMTMQKYAPLVGLFTFVTLALFSQGSLRQTSLSTPLFNISNEDTPILALPAIDLNRVKQEDESNGVPRIAVATKTAIGLHDGGQWTDLPNGDRLWRLQLQSENGLALMALYEDFYLPKGAVLFMYSPDEKQVLGPYTAADNPKSGRFMTGLIQGKEAIIEYRAPAAVTEKGRFSIFRVDQVYDDGVLETGEGEVQGGQGRGFGTSNDCHSNVNCSVGSEHQQEKRGIVRIIVVVEEGLGICTGNLMNNAKKDGTPYILTGFHCMDGYTPLYDLWRFDFNYEAEGCETPGTEPGAQALTGSVFRAGRRENDFLLLELIDTIPVDYNAYFLGWDSQPSAPDTSYIIHHPNSDIKKFAASYEQSEVFSGSIDWNNGVTTPRNHHLDVNYSVGSFEVGSSGSALLDKDGLVIGQLNGGPLVESCEDTRGWFGRLSLSWTGGGTSSSSLKDWLDPDGIAPDTIHGMENPKAVVVNGYVYTPDDFGVGNVILGLSHEDELYLTTTDTNGYYNFPAVDAGKTYNLIPTKIDNPVNGVSILDIIEIRRHILGLATLDSPYKYVAADVDKNKMVTTLDIILIQRLTLGLSEQLPGVASWQFIPDDFQFQNEQMPFTVDIPAAYILTNAEGKFELNFIGIKSGDVNLTADPQE